MVENTRTHLSQLLLGAPALTTDLRGYAHLVALHIRREADPDLRTAFERLTVYDATVQILGAAAREAKELKRQGLPESERAELVRLASDLRAMLRRLTVTGAVRDRLADLAA